MTEEYKKPEFIYVGEEEEASSNQKLLFALNELHRAQFPMALRILAFLGALISGLVAAILLVVSFVWFIVALVTLFHFRASFDRAWRQAKRLLVIFIGTSMAVFTPPLGFGLILLYFIMSGDELSDSVVHRVMGQFHTHN